MCFVNGTFTKATYASSVSLTNQWERCNAVVLSWRLGSISDDLYLSQVYFENATEVWKELKETYDKLDGSILFNLMMKINNFKQNGLLFLMGLDDVYLPIRSSLLTQTELPDVKDAVVIVSREESHKGLGSGLGV
ncbi:hypothetical protein Tco_0369314 [Tanacetum coccineum]